MTIGIDCGSLTVKGALLDNAGNVIASEHRLHNGEVVETVRGVIFALLDGMDPTMVRIGITGRHAEPLSAITGLEAKDPVACEIAGSRVLFGKVDHIFHLGGGSVMLISLDGQGNLLSLAYNSACAAGTGSFLDEQAARMDLTHEEANAIEPVASPPPIATRCAVFAKTDLIHRQQEGYSRDELWCGLCEGMSRTAVQTLLKGHSLSGRVAITGGVASSPGMVHYLRATLEQGGESDIEVLVSPKSPVCAAIGAASEGPLFEIGPILERLTSPARQTVTIQKKKRPRLELKKSRFPDFTVPISFVDDDGNEVRIHEALLHRNGYVPVILGVDVGSTSTKAALCLENGTVLADIYRRTLGDPVGAAKRLFSAMNEIERRLNLTFDVIAVGTTGSGRRIVGTIAGADIIVNEISAHVRGAVSVDPSVTTIFEIGGQDSKYMRIADGRCVDANMNYVCAAGTGTFVEELGRKLGFDVGSIGAAAIGAEPPHTSDRCTVFMEQDAFALIREGTSRQEVMAAILYSVIENYRSKVVGNRQVDRRKVMFQGATARNPGLVAAVENVFDVEVVVSPYCHVMGAIGAALLALDQIRISGGKTKFRGLWLADRAVKVTTKPCELCSNRCVISTAHIEGVSETPSFGYLCGREPTDTRMRKNEGYALYRTRRNAFRELIASGPKKGPRVGVPLALSTWGYAPLFKTLLSELGATPVFSPDTTRETARLGASTVGSDFCFPVKVAHGHIAAMLERDDLDAVFVPAMIEERRHPYASRSRFCPYMQVLHAVVKPLFEEKAIGPALVAPVLDWNLPPLEVGKYLSIAFAGVMDIDPEVGARAFETAKLAQLDFQESLIARGREAIKKLKREGKKGIVIIGRPYNTLDPIVSLNLPLKISESGFAVIPMEMLEFRPEKLGPAERNIYWHYGQKILCAVKEVADDPDLYGVYLTSFNCGPDSFILTHAEALMGEKPFLILELDEHGSDGGYATRIEAFLDVIRSRGRETTRCRTLTSCGAGPSDLKGRILWIPPMHPYGARLFPRVFRGYGIESECLPPSDEESLALGRAATRGSECTPMALTLGAFLKAIKHSGFPPEKHALFMPTATGPCRFGSYAQGQHMALERMGLGFIPIISPSSENSYLGIPTAARKTLWHAILCGDFLMKLVLARRPYEKERGTCDALAETWLERIGAELEARRDPMQALLGAAKAFEKVESYKDKRPLVGIVGEIYARCDPFANSFAIKAVEEGGGEAWLAPISEWILYTVWVARQHRDFRGEGLIDRIVSEMSNVFIEQREREYVEMMRPFLPNRMEPTIEEVAEAGMTLIPHEFEGESILTVGRTIRFFEQGADLVLNVAPFGCMHGHVTASLFERLARRYGRPIVSTFYDATGNANLTLRSFIEAARSRHCGRIMSGIMSP